MCFIQIAYYLGYLEQNITVTNSHHTYKPGSAVLRGISFFSHLLLDNQGSLKKKVFQKNKSTIKLSNL